MTRCRRRGCGSTGRTRRSSRDLRAWLTTVVSRICLDMLRARTARREDSLDTHVPDPVITPVDAAATPEAQTVLADSVSLALMVVLDTLSPAERIAFVLHDVFGMPFEQIAGVLDRSIAASKQFASRARRRVRGAPEPPAADVAVDDRWAVVDAFLAASRDGDFARLLAVLDPDVVLRADTGDGPAGPSRTVHGAADVLAQARRFAGLAAHARRVLVNGSPGFVVAPGARPFAVIGVSVRGERIAEIDILADPVRLDRLEISVRMQQDGPVDG